MQFVDTGEHICLLTEHKCKSLYCKRIIMDNAVNYVLVHCGWGTDHVRSALHVTFMDG